MSDEQPWSDNPNAPQIPYYLYFEEKADFAGVLIGSILYGILVVLFFQCTAALLNPANRKRDGIKWGLVSYTAVMFSFATVLTGMQLDIRSISFIDNREFPGDGVAPPGPLGYQEHIWSGVLTLIPDLMFIMNDWLADAFLLYRCYVVYSMNRWVVAFPFLMLLASFALGIVSLVYQASGVTNAVWGSFVSHPTTPYLSVSIPLNVLLTVMIAARLVLHGGNIRAATGPPGIGGMYKTIVTMLVESAALYAVSSLLVIAEGGSRIAYIFLPILAETQVIAPLLIVKRLANQNALTGNTVVAPPQISSFALRRGGESMGGDPPSGYPIGLGDNYGKNTGDLGVGIGVATTINLQEESKV